MDRATADLIRKRAHYCCEYCKMPQEHDDLPFQFDHIIALAHDYAGLATTIGAGVVSVAPCSARIELARIGLLDMRAQAEVPRARRSDTPPSTTARPERLSPSGRECIRPALGPNAVLVGRATLYGC